MAAGPGAYPGCLGSLGPKSIYARRIKEMRRNPSETTKLKIKKSRKVS